MKKLINRSLSCILCAALAVSGLTSPAYAQEITDRDNTVLESQDPDAAVEEDEYISTSEQGEYIADEASDDYTEVSDNPGTDPAEPTDTETDIITEEAPIETEVEVVEASDDITSDDADITISPEEPEALGAGTMFNSYLTSAAIQGESVSMNADGTVLGQLYTITNSSRLYLYISGTGTDITRNLNDTDLKAYTSSITDIIIEEGITSITADNAFSGASSLSILRLPSSIATIGDFAFYNCSSLSTVTFRPDTLISRIGRYAFYNCAFTVFDIPSPAASNSIIDEGAFTNCKKLTSFSVPTGIRIVGASAFTGCSQMSTIVFPTSLNRIGNFALDADTIKAVYFVGTESQWNKIDVLAGNENWNPSKVKFGIKNVSGISIDTDYIAINNDDITSGSITRNIVVTVTPADAMNKNVNVSSSNTGVVTVSPMSGSANDYGKLTLVLTIRKQTFTSSKTSSSATIRIVTSDGGYAAECTVIVKGKDTAASPTFDGLAGVNTTVQLTRMPLVTLYDGERHILSTTTSDAQIFYTFDKAVTQSNKWNTALIYDESTGYYKVDETYTAKNKVTVYEYTDAIIGGESEGFNEVDKNGNKVTFEAKPIYVVAVKNGMYFSPVATGTFAVRYAGPKVITDDRGDVLDEDMPEEGAIPAGLWVPVSQLANESRTRVYTGKPITIPDLRVYFGNVLLNYKTDYTLSYTRNTKSAHRGEEASPTVTVSLKGNYSGRRDFTFTIWPKVFHEEFKDYTYETVYIRDNSDDIAPDPRLVVGGIKLVLNVDYTIKYRKHGTTGEFLDRIPEGATGIYDIQITGIGDYTGTIIIEYVIYIMTDEYFEDYVIRSVPISDAIASSIPTQKLLSPNTGVTPTTRLKYQKKTLPTSLYTISYRQNTTNGTGYLIITANSDILYDPVSGAIYLKEDYIKLAKTDLIRFVGTKIIPFTIKGIPMSKVNVLDPETRKTYTNAYTMTYTGRPLEPDVDLTYTIYETIDLIEGVDYTVSYDNNIAAGKGKIILTGMGAYYGTTTRIFTIEKANSAKLTATIEKDVWDYTRSGVKPPVTVRLGDYTLKEKTDYTVVHSNNKKVATKYDDKAPTVTIKFKGSLKGENIVIKYTIRSVDIGDCSVVLEDKVATGKAGSHMQVPVVYDTYGNKLQAGTEYYKDYIYTYGEDTMVTRDSGLRLVTAGSTVNKSDIVYAGSVIKVTVTGKGNYSGTATGTYRIAEKKLSTLKFMINDQIYTGAPITPGKNAINISGLTNAEASRVYSIVSYGENTKAGTGTIVIKGIGDYAGTRTLKFKISKK
ncbi:MAG: leucine-rich repeat domain-containing protein [Lachnospiraceae bacterium]|nr:leucine-rich repeat domain-containing protein [Lachnospiraceae bacterium]